jgi:hypothetical protein
MVDDGKCSIGMHYDKMHSLDPNTIISVLKLGEIARPFCIRCRVLEFPDGADQAAKTKLQEAQPMLFDQKVASQARLPPVQACVSDTPPWTAGGSAP